MDNKQKTREEVWKYLREVAEPDSRFHLDFGEFIPDFQGSEMATERLQQLEAYKHARLVFITPDNCLERLRERALQDGKIVLVPTYGIRRGFIKLDPERISAGSEEYASWLDGMERFGERVSLAEIKHLGPIDLMVTGASVISREGVRWGKGHGFFDLEWAMMYMIGVAYEDTPIVVFVHDCQVVESVLRPSAFDTVCDLIVTPSRTIKVENPAKPTVGVIWAELEAGMLDGIQPLRELRQLMGQSGDGEEVSMN